MSWMYILGEVTGVDVKIGWTKGETPWPRIEGVNATQTDNCVYVPLAAVPAEFHQEQSVLRYFKAHKRTDKGRRKEYFHPVPEVVEYVNWLRQQWWVTLGRDELVTDRAEWDMTCPTPERRVRPPENDPDRLIQVNRSFHGDLAGTVWDWLSTPEPIGDDYYTPDYIVNAGREAMGGIDLDPASHWQANRIHKIPEYYTIHRSALNVANPWFGRIWLNPPYGNNAPWFGRILDCLDVIDQLCYLSPVWVFTAQQARPFMDRSSAMVLLTPTPTFWGHPEGRQGTNHPHAVVYMGDRPAEFREAFRPYGIPITLELNRVAELAT